MDKFKVISSTLAAILSAAFGWFGWLVILYALTMAIDYVTGTIVAFKEKCWSSHVARQGLWKKVGSLLAVLVAVLTDMLLSIAVNYAGIVLPFTYKSLLSPLVLVWYTLTELGSIVENAGRMGAPVPQILKHTLSVLREKTEEKGDNATLKK